MTTPTTTPTPDDLFEEAVASIVGDDLLLDLDRVARLLCIPSRAAVRYRLLRGTLPLRTIRTGGSQNAQVLVPTADVYALLGLTWMPPTRDELASA